MTATRRSEEQLLADAVAAVEVAFDAAGIIVADVQVARRGAALLNAVVDGNAFTVSVEYRAYCTGPAARELVVREAGIGVGRVEMVVADRVTAEAERVLGDAGWSWLDRRGHLHLRGPGVRVDIDVPASVETKAPGPQLGSRSGLTVAYWLLENPAAALSPNRHAGWLGLAPSTISTTVRRLSDAGLVDDQGAALVPELFWELAAQWRPERTWIGSIPGDDGQQHPDPEAPLWRRGGTAAAAAWGAPVVTVAGGPVELYVPGPVDVSIAGRRYGAVPAGAGAAVLAAAPVRAVCARPEAGGFTPELDGWLVAPKLAVALDLAQDRARGREILAQWDDDDAVWR